MYSPKTVIVSASPFNADCIYALLNMDERIDVVDKISSFQEAIEKMNSQLLDVLLIDIHESSDLDLIRSIFQSNKKVRKLVITSSENTWFLSSLIHIGADGFFISSASSDELINSIINIVSAKWYLPKELHNKLFCELSSREPIKDYVSPNYDNDKLDENHLDIEALTCREVEILKLMTQGKSSSQIGKELFISKATVYTHRKHILKKLGFCSTPTLIRHAVEQGVV